MIEIPGPIPIRIHPFFWVLALLIGWINGHGSFPLVAIWIGVIFVSVLVHEYGHALAAICFRQKAQIQLIAMGGVTSYNGPKLTPWQQFFIVFNGPLFGFFLFLGATLLLQQGIAFSPMMQVTLQITQWANLFWTVANLLPVIPLDGGQLLRIVLEAFFGVRGFKASLLIGAVVAFSFSTLFFVIQFYLAGALFFLFGFQSLDIWRKSRSVLQIDRDDAYKKTLIEGEIAFQQGNKEKAKELFLKVCQEAPGGLLALVAAQHLALILSQEGKRKEAYDLLLPIQEHLEDPTLCLMHDLAFEQKNDSLVAAFSAKCYQISPSQQMALRNARVFARMQEPKKAGGWLQTAWQYGGLEIQRILEEKEFVALRGDPDFEAFLHKIL